MTDTSILPGWLRVAGLIVAAGLAAATLLAPTVRGRAWAMLGALVLTPVLLVTEIWHAPQLASLRDRPVVAAVAIVAGAAVVAVLARAFTRRPGVLGVLALAALPFRVPVQSGGSTANLLVPLYAVLGAGALAWLLPRLRTRWAGEPAPRPGGLERVLAASVVLYGLQATYASDRAQALEQVVFFYVPFTLLFALLRDLEWPRRRLAQAGGVLLGLALVFAAVGFVEFATRRLLFNPKVIASNQLREYFRVNSLFFDPNIYGRFLALVMIGLAGVLLWTSRPRWLAGAVAALAVLWVGLLTTLSQSSFAALLLGLAVLAWLRWGPRVVVPPAVAAAVAGIVLVVAFPHVLRIDLDNLRSANRATAGRANLVRGGIDLARARPLLGWGSGSFQDEYRRRVRASGPEATSASHTIPITVAAEQGVVGLLVYAALLAVAVGRLLRGARRDPVRAVIAAAFLALVLHTWVYAAFLEDPLAWSLLAIGTALAAQARPGARERRAARAAARRPAAA